MTPRRKSRWLVIPLLAVLAVVAASCADTGAADDAMAEASAARSDAAAAAADAAAANSRADALEAETAAANAAAAAAQAAADEAIAAASLAQATAEGNEAAVAAAEAALAEASATAEEAQAFAAQAQEEAAAAQAEAAAAQQEAAAAQAEAAAAGEEAAAAQEALEFATDQLAAAQAAATEAGGDLPFTHVLRDGSDFVLNERIARKVRTGELINYLFSYQSSGIALFSDQYEAGFRATQDDAYRIYPMDFTIVAPVTSPSDIPEQIAQIEALVAVDQVDCLSIEPADSNSFTELTNRLLADGIPVFTVGLTTNGNEFTNFTQVPYNEGRQAADLALEFMRENGYEWDTFAVSGGDPTQFWAQGRMTGFYDKILEELPDTSFLTTPENGIQVGGGGYDPGITYDDYSAMLVGNPDLDFIENVDIGAEHANRAIIDGGREGEVFTIGWNVSYGQLDGIEQGIQVAALDQRWSEQAGFGAIACAEFLANGRILPNTQTLLPIQVDQVEAARRDLDLILGG
ncbi:MAG: substrate-binding domain-containing protein [Acidimicrobiia bacterium]|nr:substrate-binding domain-containing protein [Acidimicrobiia bacterium]